MTARLRPRTTLAAGAAALVAALGAAGLLASGGPHAGPTAGHAAARAGTDPDAAAREGGRSGPRSYAEQQYVERAYPKRRLRVAQAVAARRAFARVVQRARVAARASGARHLDAAAPAWRAAGPAGVSMPASAVQNEGAAATTVSGRVTALAVSPSCTPGACKAWVGAAGGGVWFTPDVRAAHPLWQPRSAGIPSSAIGSLLLDPASGALYAGTGEGNGSSDSEAGVGLYRSLDDGVTWTLVAGSDAAARGNAILAIAVDGAGPDAGGVWIGTAPAVHGIAATDGTALPVGAAPIGLWHRAAGGAGFTRATVVDGSIPLASGSAAGAVNAIALDRTGLGAGDRSTVYAAAMGYGVFRSAPGLDAGDARFHRILETANPFDSGGDRSELALTATHLFVYDSSDDFWTDGDATTSGGDLWRVDGVGQPTASLPAPVRLSSPNSGDPGHSAYEACQNGQCFYDLVVASPPGQPDAVLIGGSFGYDEISAFGPPSNGRAVLYCPAAGTAAAGQVACRDMTADAASPLHAIHPDQHAIAFAGSGVVIEGSDGGVVRFDVSDLVDRSGDCARRGLNGAGLADCRVLLAGIPRRIESLDAGLATLQLNSISLAPRHAATDWLAGLQDNGTIGTLDGVHWAGVAGGDGGLSGTDAGHPNWRVHTYFAPRVGVNFRTPGSAGYDTRWDVVSGPLSRSAEASAFYGPVITDPVRSGTILAGLQHVWRTRDFGGSQARLEAHCNELTGDFVGTSSETLCGDFTPIGGDLTGSAYGGDRLGGYVVALGRAPSDTGTLWATTLAGRVFVSRNAGARRARDVRFARLDGRARNDPPRTAPSLAVDPVHALGAFVGYSGYGSNTPTVRGHVFAVTADPLGRAPVWRDLSFDLGDQPVNAVAYDAASGDLFAGTDFGVLRLPAGATRWQPAGGGLPVVAVSDLRLDVRARVLVAATHGRGAYALRLDDPGAPPLRRSPRVVGVARPGGVVRCAAGAFSGAAQTRLVWVRDGLAAGDGARPRRLALADVGRSLACRMRASRGGAVASAISAPVVVAPARAILRSTTRRVQAGPTIVVRGRVSTLARGRVVVERRSGRHWVALASRRLPTGLRRVAFSVAAGAGTVRLRLRFVPRDARLAAVVVLPVTVRVG